MKIEAVGNVNGVKTTVVCEGDGEQFNYLFNGVENDELRELLRIRTEENHPIGGTYYPQTWALKLVATLDGWFFDSPPKRLDVDGEIESIPYEKGLIY